MRGVYREIVPPERLVNTESWGGDWPETLNTLVLTEEDGQTMTVCTVLYPSKEARDRALGTGMKEGWSELRPLRRVPAHIGGVKVWAETRAGARPLGPTRLSAF